MGLVKVVSDGVKKIFLHCVIPTGGHILSALGCSVAKYIRNAALILVSSLDVGTSRTEAEDI
jgi:hypothetical protein